MFQKLLPPIKWTNSFPKMWLLLVISVGVISVQSISDPDLGWHIASGEYMYQTKRLITEDIFSFSLPEFSYVHHSWLQDLIISRVYGIFGLWGIQLWYSFLLILSALFLWFGFEQVNSKTDYVDLGIFLLVFHLMVSFIGLRTHLFSIFGFSVLYVLSMVLTKYLDPQTVSLKKSWLKYFGLVGGLFFIWSQMHAGVITGLLFVGVLGLVTIASLSWNNSRILLPYSGIFVTMLISLFIITLINPNGLKLYAFVYELGTNAVSRTYNTDWLPLLSSSLPSDSLFLRVGLLLLSITTILVTKQKVNKILLLTFTLATVYSLRFSLILFVLIIPLSSHLLASFLKQYTASKHTRAVAIGLFVFLGVTRIGKISEAWCTHTNQICYAKTFNYPLNAIEALNKYDQNAQVFNHYTWGGYILWQAPEMKVFIDGRMDNFLVEGIPFLDEFVNIEQLNSDWYQRLMLYQPDAILLPTSWPLTNAIREKSEWRQVYTDDLATVFVLSSVESK